MLVKFSKMHGLGNDFVVFDGVSAPIELDEQQIRRIADRRFGIGCDQVLVVDPPAAADIDFGYRIYNADGSAVGQCGNGARALVRFVHRRGLAEKTALRIATMSTAFDAELLADGRVCVDLPPPLLEPRLIPLAREGPAERYQFDVHGQRVDAAAIGLGNPHAVIEVGELEHAPVQTLGAGLSVHPDFPEGVNVGFLQVMSPERLRLRVYERGVGETLACGSGACAAVVAARLWHRCEPAVSIELRGGELFIRWTGPGQPIRMTGPAEFVFDGEWEL